MVAKDAKNKFGQLLTAAMREPVIIDKNGKSVAILMSTEEFRRLEQIEDELITIKAQLALKEGFIGEDESEKFLSDLVNAKD